MSKFSDFLEAKLIDHILRNTPYTGPAQVYLSLYTSDPTDADTGTEVSAVGTGYERMPITFVVPVDGVTSNDSLISFPVALTNWGTITHIGLRDALTGGNLLFHGPITPTHTVNASARIEFPQGSIQVQLL